jgi:ABC-type maltose transport system permease subunit
MKTLINIDVIFVESSRFVLDSIIDVFIDIFLFVFLFELITVVLVSRVIVDLITKYVIIDSKNLVDELNRLKQKIIKRREFERQMKTHDKQRIFENSSIVINFFSRVLVIIASIIITSIINDLNRFNFFENSSRISNRH